MYQELIDQENRPYERMKRIYDNIINNQKIILNPLRKKARTLFSNTSEIATKIEHKPSQREIS